MTNPASSTRSVSLRTSGSARLCTAALKRTVFPWSFAFREGFVADAVKRSRAEMTLGSSWVNSIGAVSRQCAWVSVKLKRFDCGNPTTSTDWPRAGGFESSKTRCMLPYLPLSTSAWPPPQLAVTTPFARTGPEAAICPGSRYLSLLTWGAENGDFASVRTTMFDGSGHWKIRPAYLRMEPVWGLVYPQMSIVRPISGMNSAAGLLSTKSATYRVSPSAQRTMISQRMFVSLGRMSRTSPPTRTHSQSHRPARISPMRTSRAPGAAPSPMTERWLNRADGKLGVASNRRPRTRTRSPRLTDGTSSTLRSGATYAPMVPSVRTIDLASGGIALTTVPSTSNSAGRTFAFLLRTASSWKFVTTCRPSAAKTAEAHIRNAGRNCRARLGSRTFTPEQYTTSFP